MKTVKNKNKYFQINQICIFCNLNILKKIINFFELNLNFFANYRNKCFLVENNKK